jgi:hypothetical protein
MDTGILHLTGRSCHDNKSQRADPFVVLSRIIAGKTKYVKDPFLLRSSMKPVMTRVDGCFTVFGRIGVMPGQTGSNKKGREQGREDALREF